MIADMQDENGRITIPGFYDDVIEASAKEREMLNKKPHCDEEYKKAINVKALKAKQVTQLLNVQVFVQVLMFVEFGVVILAKEQTVLPSKAYAKISTRLVPNQDNVKISKLFKEHFKLLHQIM